MGPDFADKAVVISSKQRATKANLQPPAIEDMGTLSPLQEAGRAVREGEPEENEEADVSKVNGTNTEEIAGKAPELAEYSDVCNVPRVDPSMHEQSDRNTLAAWAGAGWPGAGWPGALRSLGMYKDLEAGIVKHQR